MKAEVIKLIADRFRDEFQLRLDDIRAKTGRPAVSVGDVLDPFTDDTMDLVNTPGIVVDLAPQLSPSAEFQTFDKADVSVPVLIRYITDHLDQADARTEVSDALRAILHVLNDLFVNRGTLYDVQLINMDDLVFDTVLSDGDKLTGIVYLTATARDITP